MSHKMQEFILWSNCTNQCDFCWQCKKHDQSTILNSGEMIKCLCDLDWKLDEITNGDDVLLVGGEILNPYSDSVNYNLRVTITKCINMLKSNKIRYLYINTNLLYKDRSNLDYLLYNIVINGLSDRLKFTTSYDIYGRFKNYESEKLFLENLKYIYKYYPKINIVVNAIITKQLVNSDFNWDEFQQDYGIKYINFIPYIPVKDDRTMDVTFKDIVKILARQEKRHPGYISFYIKDFDLNQDKILYEYHKDKGFIECTAKYAECGHNENFKKVLGDECYICKLKDIFG